MFTKSTGNKFSTISVHDLDERLGKIDLIDIREDYEYKSGHIPKAKNIPMGQLLAKPDKYLDKEKEYHIICQSGGRSARACDELSSQGYKIINVSGGTGSYIKPLER
ncbi:rhodanese-like domain-containing protein [Clostridium folliculivorans]|uniref:Sulfurtransferase n=1 Tax=Clostridium folliculivorans TaxID=2886038 RepID=A0A9W5XYC5_9CLOT|nr:rhodanese-like domain-containing protein [Clostridium folliculivorans]GKU23197.1 sulfurtransferase [Clostridium folliculivorans]GKU29243.1 sulfurtransferase [Clostridium folliculivorans]